MNNVHEDTELTGWLDSRIRVVLFFAKIRVVRGKIRMVNKLPSLLKSRTAGKSADMKVAQNPDFGLVISDIPLVGWILAIASAFILGLAKSGLKGMGVIIVMLLALAFESKVSTGILMPLLLVGDVFAVIHYHRHAQWSHLWRLLPWMLAGVLIGVWFGKDLNEEQFKHWMAILILSSTALMIWGEIRKRLTVPKHGIFGATMGLFAGISTMIGNLAGPFADLYFLAMRLPKQNFIGTAAWLFFIVNIFKLPFHIFVWRTINRETLLIDLWLLPAVVGGLIIGVWLVSRIHDLRYRKIVIALTAIGAILILTG